MLNVKPLHDPDAVLDYTVKWGDWLGEQDRIVASEWKELTGGLVAVSNPSDPGDPGFTDDTATAWLTSGTPGEYGTATNHITTLQGRQDDRTIRLKVKEQ